MNVECHWIHKPTYRLVEYDAERLRDLRSGECLRGGGERECRRGGVFDLDLTKEHRKFKRISNKYVEGNEQDKCGLAGEKLTSNTSEMGANGMNRICVAVYRFVQHQWVIVVDRGIGHVSRSAGLDSVTLIAHSCLN